MMFKRARVTVRRPPTVPTRREEVPHLCPGNFWFLWECEACGALVEEGSRDKHEKWHGKLEKGA